MELRGENRIPAPRARVWALLNDADVLRACIPGCESLEGSPVEGFSARVTTKIGPVKATFNGSVALSNVNAPESYTISGEGKGGVAGFAKGGADVHLREDGSDTVLTYVVNAQVGGKLAQLGSRLIDSTAKKLADQFFACFAERAGVPVEAAAVPVTPLPVADSVLTSVQPVERAATDAPIPERPGTAETVTPIASAPNVDVAPLHHGTAAPVVPPASAASQAPGAAIQHLAHEVEEEVEREAAVGFLGGPTVWGLLVILALLGVYVIAT